MSEFWGGIERPRTLALILGSALLSVGSFVGGATGAVPPETAGVVCGTLAIVVVLYSEHLCPAPGETPLKATLAVLTLGLGALLVSTPAFFDGAFAREAVTLGNPRAENIKMIEDLLVQAGTVLASALVASLAYFAAKRRGSSERFDPRKAAATVLAAFAVSVVLLVTGEATGREDLLAQLSLFVGPVAVWLQRLLKRAQETDQPSKER
jgi:hypothetical protein